MDSLKPCPFCGKPMDEEDQDTLYPSGIWWEGASEADIIHYLSSKERTEGSLPCYKVVCNEIYGGCGASLDGDSVKEVMTKWNKRV